MARASANVHITKNLGSGSDKEIKAINTRKRLFLLEDPDSIMPKRIQELDELLYRIVRQCHTPNSVRDSIRMLCAFLNMHTLGICLFDKDKNITHVDSMLGLNLISLVGNSFKAFCNLLGIEDRLTLPGERMQINFTKNSQSFLLSFYEYNLGYVALIYNLTELTPELDRIMGMGKAAQYLWTILEASADGMVVVDANLQVVYYNRAFALLSGIADEQHYGVNTEDMVAKGMYSLSVSNAVLQNKKSVSMLQKYQNGSKCLVTGNPVFDDNGNIKFVVLNVREYTVLQNLNDITKEQTNRNLPSNADKNSAYIFESRAMQNIYQLALNVAKVDSPVILYGEPGVGKEVIADLLHEYNEERNQYPIVKVNCASIPKDMLESELFGYEAAFPGTSGSGKQSVFELADKGTLFLEEIGVLPLELQTKLLDFLNNQQSSRWGETRSIKTNVRIIASTNADLTQMISAGTFRADLYYRLNVIPIHIPPLRERRDDIIPLGKRLLTDLNEKYGLNKNLNSDILDWMIRYEWPGNVLELTNLIERLVVTVPGDCITIQDLPAEYADNKVQLSASFEKQTLNEALEAFEAQYLKEAFEIYGSSYRVAEELGISQTTAYRKAKRYNLI